MTFVKPSIFHLLVLVLTPWLFGQAVQPSATSKYLEQALATQHTDPHAAIKALQALTHPFHKIDEQTQFDANFYLVQLYFKTEQYEAAKQQIEAISRSQGRNDRFAAWVALLNVQQLLFEQQLENVNPLFQSYYPFYHDQEQPRLKLWYRLIAGTVEVRRDNFDIALKKLMNGLHQAQDLGETGAELQFYNQLVQLFYHMGNYPRALEISAEMLAVAQARQDKYYEVWALASQMNIHYMTANKISQSFDSADPAEHEKLHEDIERSRDKSIALQHRVIELSEAIGADRPKAWAMILKQNLKLYEENFQQTIAVAEETIALGKRHGLKFEQAVSYNNMAIALRYLGEHQKGLDALAKAEDYYRATDNQQSLLWVLEDYAIAHELNNDFATALDYYRKYHEASISLLKKTNNQAVLKLQEEFATREKAQQIEQLNQQADLAAEKIASERLGRSLLIVILVATFIILLMQYSKRKKLNRLLRNEAAMSQKILDLSKAKQRFFSNLSHEFRTALTLSTGPLKQLIKSENIHMKSDRDAIQCALDNNLHMMSLLGDVFSLEQLEGQSLQSHPVWFNIADNIESCLARFQLKLKQQGLQIDRSSINPSLEMNIDPSHFDKVMTNLISNAIKFSKRDSEITITAYQKDSATFITICDQGVGIEPEEQPHVFERFYQGKQSSKQTMPGTGVGLSMVKELVELYRGSVGLESYPEMGTLITLCFPSTLVREAALSKDFAAPALTATSTTQLATETLTPSATATLDRQQSAIKAQQSTTDRGQTQTVLVIDDNVKIRDYMRSILEQAYTVIEAENGEAGLNLAEQMQPDIVISDVMMPVMDGFEVLRLLRANPKIAHLPVILLTALGDKENTIKGLTLGADDYLTKPFDSDQLLAKVANIMKQKKRLAEVLYQKIRASLTHTQKPLDSFESKRCQKLEKVIADNLGQWEFDVEQMFTELNMTRSTLFRYTKRVYGCSPKSLLRKRRLETAFEMLQKNNGTVSEIAYAVGFQSLSTFSRAFSEQYQQPPTKVQKQNELAE